jgi:hypothetical protein
MDERERLARRVSAACAELRDEVANVGLDFLSHLLSLVILEATKSQALPTAPPAP